MNVTRLIGSEKQLVGSGFTGATGTLTLWLNPDFVHDFFFTKSGFITITDSFAPTLTSYTIQFGGSNLNLSNDLTRGISYQIRPPQGELLNNTNYVFNITLASSFWTVDSFGFVLRDENGNILATNSSANNGGTVSINNNTGNLSNIIMDYFWIIDGNVSNATSSWVIISSEGTQWSIKVFFSDLDVYLTSGMFGLDNFGLAVISFMSIFIFAGIMSFKFGLRSPQAIAFLIGGMVVFLDVGTDLLDNLNPTPVPFFPTIIVIMALIGIYTKEALR